MKRLPHILILAAVSVSALAQDPVTLRQQSFPTALPMTDDNIEWQRDIYRELDLTKDENAGLYCPQEPSASQRGLFTKVFSLAVAKMIPIYRYNIDGNEVFNDATKMDVKDVLENHHIRYEEEDGHILVDGNDIPASEVMAYYVKEGVYYDLTNSTFRIRVLAICPVLIQDDEYSEGPIRYPLFWVEYKDLEPYLKDVTIIPNSTNMALVVPMTDYFTLNMYKGTIYKVGNALGRTLRQYVSSDSALVRERQRIEQELERIRKNTYNTYHKDSKETKHTSQ